MSDISKFDNVDPEDIENFDTEGFFRKVKQFASKIPFAEDLVAGYYAMRDPKTAFSHKASLFGALVYFVLPIDAIPDAIPFIGYLDDAGVLAAAMKFVGKAVTPEHRKLARQFLS